MRTGRLPWMVLSLCLSPLGMTTAQQTSELHGGRWVGAANSTTQQAVDPGLLRVEQLLRNGSYGQAQKEAVAWLKTNKGSAVFDRGLYLMAEALFQRGDRMKSFYYLDELLDEYPDSTLYYQALEKQYDIADAFLSGFKRKILGLRISGATEEALEILFRIQQRSPRSQLAEKSLLRTADFYYADAQYDLAEDAYRVYRQSYPNSPYVPRVALLEAYANLAQFRGLRFDATPVIDAREQLQAIVARYPEMASKENIPAVLERIDNTFARKLAVTADFYRRTHEPRASAFTYDYLLKNYPNTTEAPRAQQALDRLGGTVPGLNQSGPQLGPTTGPVSDSGGGDALKP